MWSISHPYPSLPLNYSPELESVCHPNFDVWIKVKPSEFDVYNPTLKDLITSLSVQSICEDVLVHGIVKAMQGREMFTDTDDELDEKMYAGHVFEDLLTEQAEMPDNMKPKLLPKEMEQLEELAKIVNADYVLITKV